ncbi:MAG: zf-TFIIB domain-containing protein [Phyllobacteriaceae bacterium]|nr:zf-TFIIB domain-containing protein [Phyllobacteriaceae bacterium]
MQCPVDGETLLMSERNGVEIDYCPRCRGIWLDRGELDKIIERAGSPEGGYQPVQNRYQEKTRPSKKEEKRDRRKENPYASKGSRTRSFLEDIFDFD